MVESECWKVKNMNKDLTSEQQIIKDKANAHANKIKKVFAKEITDKIKFPKEKDPVSVFMAGSPGAGKTEASKALLDNFDGRVIRIDADEYREQFEDYSGDNSWLFQSAVSILVEKAHDLVIKNSQSFLLDGTLTNYEKAVKNIERSIKRNRMVQILYVYQEPTRAWEFVKAREEVEGRNIPLDRFISQYFEARDCVNRLKGVFDKAIKVDLLIQDRENQQMSYKANIDKIDNYLPEKYTPATLETLLGKG
jgi:UDP-N-acetylglucosamine kinase